MKLGIIGNGFVGLATQQLKCTTIDILVYDIVPTLCVPENLRFEDLTQCDMVFICLPTPMNIDGSCYTTTVSTAIYDLKKLDYHNIIVRSTVPINFCTIHKVFFMPEFLTERNWKQDFTNNELWILGLTSTPLDDTIVDKFTHMIHQAHMHNKITSREIAYISSTEAEMVKLIKNTFLACKVGFFNEMYDLSQKLNINYDNVIAIIGNDIRIGDSHMQVPGHDGNKGYGGTCFPKDVHNMYDIMNKNDVKSYYIKSSLERNEMYDRINMLEHNNRTVLKVNKRIVLLTGTYIACSKLYEQLLADPNNFVVCNYNLSDKVNFLHCSVAPHKMMFLSKIDTIYCVFDGDVVCIKHNIKILYNVLKMTKLHNCETYFTVPEDIYGSMIEEYTHKHHLKVHVS